MSHVTSYRDAAKVMQKIDFLNEKEVIFCLHVKDFSENGKNTELSHGNIFVTHDDKKKLTVIIS